MKLTLIGLLMTIAALAQTAGDAPNLVKIIRNGSIQPYSLGNARVNVVGMMAISGLTETWLIEMHDSFGSLEDLDKALAAIAPLPLPPPSINPSGDDILTPSRALIAVYRPGLSYRPDQAVQMLP